MSTAIITDAEALAFLKIPATVVDQDSASGQPILYTRATINFAVGDVLIIGRGTVREETKTILTIQSGISLTTSVNLEFTHTALQADTAEVGHQDVAIISGIVLAIDKRFKNYCARCFNKVTGAIEYYDGDGSAELWLRDYPVTSISVVINIDFDGDQVFDGDDEDAQDYVVYPEKGLIYHRLHFPVGHRNIKVTLDKGFADTDMPEDLKLVCKMEVKYLYTRWKEDSRGLKDYSVAGMKKTFEPKLSSFSLMILQENYVKLRA